MADTPDFGEIQAFVAVAEAQSFSKAARSTGLSRSALGKALVRLEARLGTRLLHRTTRSISGTAALFHASDIAFEVLKFAGVGYLLFMAWTMLRSRGALVVPKENGRFDDLSVIQKAIVLNLLNPKLSIFFLAFLPQFVGAGEAAPGLRMTALGRAFMAATFLVFAAYGIAASSLRRHVLASSTAQVWLQRSFAVAFGLLALQLALTER